MGECRSAAALEPWPWHRPLEPWAVPIACGCMFGGAIRRWPWWAGVAVPGWIVVLATSLFPVMFVRPRLNYDSGGYLAAPSLTSGRLPVVPVLFALCAHQLEVIALVQAAVGVACWCFLISEAARAQWKVAAVVGVVAVTLLAGSTYVVSWYAAILSDSLSISVLVLVVGLIARLLRTRGSCWPLVIAASVWALIRPTNGEIVLMAALLIVLPVTIRYRHHLPEVAAAALISLVAIFLAGQGGLWQQPFEHSLTERILPNREFTAWFVGHGMPLTPQLEQLAGPLYPAQSQTLNDSPGLRSFRAWMDRSGKDTFAEFLATHPGWMLVGAFKPHEELLDNGYYGGGVPRAWYPASLRNILLVHRQSTMLGVLAVAGLLITTLGIRRRLRYVASEVLIWLCLVLLGIAALAIDWGADSWEIARHSVDGTLLVVLAGIMATVLLPRPPGHKPDLSSVPETASDQDFWRQARRSSVC